MEKKIDIQAIKNSFRGDWGDSNFTDWCMVEAIRQALKLAVENATTKTVGASDGYECWEITSVDEQSILNIEKLIINYEK